MMLSRRGPAATNRDSNSPTFADLVDVSDTLTQSVGYHRGFGDSVGISEQTWFVNETPDWFDQMEFYYNFTNKSADTNLNGNTSDSGHAVTSNYGADIEGVAQIIASPIDGTMVCTDLDTQADSSASHLLTPALAANILFFRARVRFGTTGSTDSPFMMGPWSNWPEQNTTTTSPAHMLFYRTEARAQIYTNLAASTIWQNIYSVAPAGWQDCYVALDPVAGAVVVGLPDGTTRSFLSPSAASLTDYNIGDFEFFHTAPNTDRRIEMARIGCATAAGMTTQVADAYDALLVSEGYGSAYTPPAGVGFIAASNLDSATQDATPANASVSHAGGADADVAIMYVCVTSQTSSGAPSTHTRSATYGGVAMTSLGAVSHNNETDAPTGWIEAFKLEGCPTGTQTAAVQVSKASANYRIRGVVFTFSGVASVGTPVTAAGTGSGTPMGITVPSAVGDVVIIGGTAESTGSIGGPDGTVIREAAYSSTSYGAAPFLVEYLPGAASVTDTFTRAVAAADWSAVGVNLVKT
jgi:hypothetical protein